MVNIIVSLINFVILLSLAIILFLAEKKKKNQYFLLFNFSLFFSILALILRVISEYFLKLSYLMNYSYGSTLISSLALIFVFICILLRKENFKKKTLYLFFLSGLLINVLFGKFYYFVGDFFYIVIIILSFILIVLSLWIFFYSKQKIALCFLAYIILMTIAGFIDASFKTLDLIVRCFAYFTLIFGALTFGKRGFLNEGRIAFEKWSNFQKIAPRIIISFSSLFIIAMFLAGLIIISLSQQTFEKNYYSQISNINGTKFEQINTFLNSEKEIVLILAASTVFRDFLNLLPTTNNYLIEKERTVQRLNRSLQSVKQITEIFIIDKEGKIIVSTDKTQEGQDKSKDFYFLEGQKKVFIKSPYFSENLKKNTYTVSAPINDGESGKLLGVIVLRMNPQNLFNITQSGIGLGKTGETFLIDKDNYFLTPSKFLGKEVVLTKKIDTQNAKDCFTKEEMDLSKNLGYPQRKGEEEVKNYIDYRGIDIIGTHAFISEANWCLITKIDKAEFLSTSRLLLLIFGAVFIMVLILFFIIGLRVSRIITKPINNLYLGVKEIEKGDLDYKIKIESKDEIGQLAEAFNKMIFTVKESKVGIEKKVFEQTKEINEKAEKLDKQKKAVLNVLADVKEEKNKVDLLVHDLEKFKLAVENASDHIAITDIDGKIIYANKGVEEITQYPIDKIIGQKAGAKENWGGLMEKTFYQKLWKTIKEDKKNFSGEISNKKADGSLYTALASIAPVLDEKNNIIFFVGIERDITKEKQIDKAKTEFVSLASHQLRTPLSAINWYTEMILAGDVGKVNKEQKKYLGEVYQASKRMVDLINALLNTSRIDLGTFTIEPVSCNLVEIADSVVEELSHEVFLKKIKFDKKYNPKKIEINIDPKLTRIIFQNLLSNSVKYTQEKGKVSLFLEKNEKDVLIKVIDNGYGIPKSAQDKIFNKLFRADNIKEKDTNGTGLGLYIVKAIIEQSGGKIWFESEENKGTTFFVSIPLTGMKAKGGTKELS